MIGHRNVGNGKGDAGDTWFWGPGTGSHQGNMKGEPLWPLGALGQGERSKTNAGTGKALRQTLRATLGAGRWK